MHITTPSGFSGEIRKLKGSEANILSDRKAARKGTTYDKILGSCWLGTTDPGPYEKIGISAEGSVVPWGKVLVCDRFYTLAAIRIVTYGPIYTFPVQCGETGRGCGHQFEWDVNIETDLPLYDLPDESRQKVAAGDNRFELGLDGKKIVFKLLTGIDERKAGNAIADNSKEVFTTALASRIVEVEGLDRRKRDQITRYLDDLDLDIQLGLLAEFEEVDGGFDTEFEVECPKCDRIQRVAVPFEGEAFWLPRSHKPTKSEATSKRKRRKARTMAQRREEAEAEAAPES